MQYHEVKISLELREVKDCYWAGVADGDAPGGWATDLSKAEVGSLKAASLYVDYIYLDTDERRRFAQVSHEYLIEQLQFTGDESTSNTNNKIKLSLNHPVRELVWVVQPDDNVSDAAPFGKQWFNYTDDYDLSYVSAYSTASADVVTASDNAAGLPGIAAGGANAVFVPTSFEGGANPVLRAKLQLNGHDRFSERDGRYFNLVQPYQHHENVPSKGINVYSFALKPEEHQPSGTCNMSRIDNATLNLTLTRGSVEKTVNSSTQSRTVKVRVYGVNFNVLRIMSGRSPFHACKSYTQHNSWHRYVGKSFGYPGHLVAQRRCIPVASGLYRPQDTLLFGKPLRALSTNVCLERADRPRIMNLGMVTMTKIGQPACLSPKLANRQEHGEASETERVSVVNASLVRLRRLKIQSGPVGNHTGPSDGRLKLIQVC